MNALTNGYIINRIKYRYFSVRSFGIFFIIKLYCTRDLMP